MVDQCSVNIKSNNTQKTVNQKLLTALCANNMSIKSVSKSKVGAYFGNALKIN